MAEQGIFEVVVESVAGAKVVHVIGELDLATAPELESALEPRESEGGLVVDLGECTFADSSSVHLLLELARERAANGGRTAIAVTDPGVLRVLEITALDTLVPVHATVDDALADVT